MGVLRIIFGGWVHKKLEKSQTAFIKDQKGVSG
jgi:hypothetical protein